MFAIRSPGQTWNLTDGEVTAEMRPELLAAVETAISRATEGAVSVSQADSVYGGSINSAVLLTLVDGRRLFLKTHPSPPPHMFVREAEGLRSLAEASALRVPHPIVHGSEPFPFLVMEAIETGARAPASSRTSGGNSPSHTGMRHAGSTDSNTTTTSARPPSPMVGELRGPSSGASGGWVTSCGWQSQLAGPTQSCSG